MLRKERTKKYNRQIESEYSLYVLYKLIEEGKKSGEILSIAYWDDVIHHPKFQIEWLDYVNPSEWDCWWEFEYISMSKNFDISWVDKYPNENWDWGEISDAPNYNDSWKLKYPDKEWTTCFILNFPYRTIQSDEEEKGFVEVKRSEYLSAYRIQQWWKHITISPNYAIGRKFINKSYDELFH